MANVKPNILWIMTDQHRADCLGCMGHPVIQTPNLDRLAGEGIVFENAFCQSPACMASRASLFTGRYPSAIRVRGMGILPPAETTFPEWLRRQGYNTGAFGKVHFTPEQFTCKNLGSRVPILDWRSFAAEAAFPPIPDDPYKENYGFEVHEGCDDACRGLHQAWLRRRKFSLPDKKPVHPEPDGPADLFISPYSSAEHATTYIASEAEAYIRQDRAGAPWFAFCSFIAPHHPFEAPADQIARYPLAGLPLPALKGGIQAEFIPPPARSAVGEMDRYRAPVQRRIVQHYLASISLIDDAVGRLLDALEATGQIDRTLVVFVSDHGEFLGNHGLLRKPSLHYDETLRVPLLLRLPDRIAGGRRINGLVELTDVYPTLLGLLGLPINPGVQGIDWSGNIRSGTPIGREDIFADMFDLKPLCAKLTGPYMAVMTLRTARWKLNVYPTAGQEFGQLFDLQSDPDEAENLYATPQYRSIREEMLWRLTQRCHLNTDPLPFLLTQW